MKNKQTITCVPRKEYSDVRHTKVARSDKILRYKWETADMKQVQLCHDETCRTSIAFSLRAVRWDSRRRPRGHLRANTPRRLFTLAARTLHLILALPRSGLIFYDAGTRYVLHEVSSLARYISACPMPSLPHRFNARQADKMPGFRSATYSTTMPYGGGC